jgi:SAM-dependent methyltransferase
MTDTATPNADQAAFWNDAGGRTWVDLNDLLDRQIEPIGLRGMAALAPKPGERVLDVGCGCGQTTLALAGRVGPTGQVTGLDISRPMLELARRRAADAGLANTRFIEADAQTHRFEAATFDALFSRFGVMFFADPPAAFRNLAGAIRPGGRLAFVCWRGLAENTWMTTPLQAALKHIPAPAPPVPGAPGPFAFADPERVRTILQAAGFADIGFEPFDTQIGGNSLEDSVRMALRVGPLGAMLRENPAAAPKATDDIREALAGKLRDGQVWMDGAVWIVTAARP